jgi:hypothetical protein
MTVETVMVWLVAGVLLLSLLWLRWRKTPSQINSPEPAGQNWCLDDLLARGIEGAEAQLLQQILQLTEQQEPARLLNSRLGFEHALRCALEMEPDLMRDLEMRRALDRIRIRRGWEMQGVNTQSVSLPFEDEELLIQGPDGVHVRSVAIHRDSHSIAVRVVEQGNRAQTDLHWRVGDDLQVAFFREDLGGLHFETRLQEKRELGEWFLFLETPDRIRVQQRRRFARIPNETPIRFLHLPMGSRTQDDPDRQLLQEANLIDIGTGGLALSTEAPLQRGDLLVIRGIPTLESHDITARVVAAVEDPEGEDPEGGVGVRFVGLSGIDRDRIASLVFSSRIKTTDVCFSDDPGEPTPGSEEASSA